jgi:hypothetical protein
MSEHIQSEADVLMVEEGAVLVLEDEEFSKLHRFRGHAINTAAQEDGEIGSMCVAMFLKSFRPALATCAMATALLRPFLRNGHNACVAPTNRVRAARAID